MNIHHILYIQYYKYLSPLELFLLRIQTQRYFMVRFLGNQPIVYWKQTNNGFPYFFTIDKFVLFRQAIVNNVNTGEELLHSSPHNQTI